MKKKLKIMSLLVFVGCSSFTINAYQVNLSFDSLFPMTWYQKGLESSLSVWQALVNVFDKSSDSALLSFDLLLGRLAFAQFCIARMYQDGVPCIADDSIYFSTVLHKVKQLLNLIVITPENRDYVFCVDSMIQAMQQQLNKTE